MFQIRLFVDMKAEMSKECVFLTLVEKNLKKFLCFNFPSPKLSPSQPTPNQLSILQREML